jgi:HEPN domain-containing protein
MPPRRTIPGTPQEWLARAKSNLLMTKGVKVEGIFWEDLCFNAQQAAEKSIKAVLQHKQIPFRYVHDLEELITALENHKVVVPQSIKDAEVLSQYAFATRYPGELEEVTEEEYHRAITLAEQVVHWAESLLTPSTP